MSQTQSAKSPFEQFLVRVWVIPAAIIAWTKAVSRLVFLKKKNVFTWKWCWRWKEGFFREMDNFEFAYFKHFSATSAFWPILSYFNYFQGFDFAILAIFKSQPCNLGYFQHHNHAILAIFNPSTLLFWLFCYLMIMTILALLETMTISNCCLTHFLSLNFANLAIFITLAVSNGYFTNFRLFVTSSKLK